MFGTLVTSRCQTIDTSILPILQAVVLIQITLASERLKVVIRRVISLRVEQVKPQLPLISQPRFIPALLNLILINRRLSISMTLLLFLISRRLKPNTTCTILPCLCHFLTNLVHHHFLRRSCLCPRLLKRQLSHLPSRSIPRLPERVRFRYIVLIRHEYLLIEDALLHDTYPV